MKSLVARKMAKQKTFYEIKVQPQHAIHHTMSPLHHGMGITTNVNNHYSNQMNNSNRFLNTQSLVIKNQQAA